MDLHLCVTNLFSCYGVKIYVLGFIEFLALLEICFWYLILINGCLGNRKSDFGEIGMEMVHGNLLLHVHKH